MKNKISQYKDFGLRYIQRLNDIRFAGQVVFVIIVLLISWSGVKAIQTNYGLQKQALAIAQQNSLQQLQNNNLKLQNEYYNSNQYLELSARQNFGLAAPGEKEIVVPKNVALSYAPSLPTISSSGVIAQQPKTERNVQAWVNFFLHRQLTSN
jgi:cell division protein FtsB